jgi:hypothetical protein
MCLFPWHATVSVALVVGHDEDDVGSRRAKSGEEQGAGGEEEQAHGPMRSCRPKRLTEIP